MLTFSKLRLHGFKSFVDKTEVEIGPGLNGVIGPNGCGKSNLVEAMRWVMGEGSAKRMRGGGMEDVIFAGTSKRPARNIAEVSLLLDNSKRTAPAAYNGMDEIEVVRRIERDRGSLYKINGKTVRARDVQMLFADTVTGANSPAMVSQGRVAKIIGAKPLERRIVLEESAGISGLYARRHEAELRLRAADKNLERIDDILGGIQGRLNSLKRQARQAHKYRNLSAQIRQLEIQIAWMEWNALNNKKKETQKSFEASESIVAEKMTAVTQLTKTREVQLKDVAPLRHKEAEVAARLQKLKLDLARLEDEEERLSSDLKTVSTQLEQAKTDHEHETKTLKESEDRLTQLAEQFEALNNNEIDMKDIIEEKGKEVDKLAEDVKILEEQHSLKLQSEADIKARKQALTTTLEQNKKRIESLKAREEETQNALKAMQDSSDIAALVKTLDQQIENKDKSLETDTQSIESLKEKTQTLQPQIREARTVLKESEDVQAKLMAEIETLQTFIHQDNAEHAPVRDQISAEDGFEMAISRALGESLMGSLNTDAPMIWNTRTKPENLSDLPNGTESLLSHVKAPDALNLALSQIGLVENDAKGNNLSNSLKPGQALVSRNGTFWRWDGLQIKAEASDRNAVHLAQKNKLKGLEDKRPKIEKAVATAQKTLSDLEEKQKNNEDQQDALSNTIRQTQNELRTLREERNTHREKIIRFESEEKRLKDALKTAAQDIKTLAEVIAWDEKRLQTIIEEENKTSDHEGLDKLREKLQDTRTRYQDASRTYDRLVQENSSREARMRAIADERVNLNNRAIRAHERIKELDERKENLSEQKAELNVKPKDITTKKEKSLSLIAACETERTAFAEQLAALENDITETDKGLRDAERILSKAREDRAHAQATFTALNEQAESMTATIQEKFGMQPEALKNNAATDLERMVSELPELRAQKERLTGQRDAIGPVNLRAEEEAAEVEKEVGTLIHERTDLVQAIEELRGGIQKINKEARERLVKAFESVNEHFKVLFTKLFAGGQAHLALIDSDDPLGAGLEIFAQPPGKTLQSLSLLSGGEQALTSIALIFAMFLTNPSPICVLDEIDAPLDDANVDRVCALLEHMAEQGTTRFLVITHHRMTMARMDRIYGVTMAEKGVSTLVSVDMQQSFEFLDAA